MGIKMGTALDSTGREWSAETYKKGMGDEPLQCSGCTIRVLHTSAYPREFDGKPHLVSAYFKLPAGIRHDNGCKFNVKGAVEHIAKESEDLLESIEKGKYRLRLVMVKDAIAGGTTNPNKERSNANNQVGHTIKKQDHSKLLAYINSARRVLWLRAKCDEDSDLSEHLELVFEGNSVVRWTKFYFESPRHLEAFVTIRRTTVQYPIALHGIVESKKFGIGKFKGNVITLRKNKYRENPKDATNSIGVEVSAWFNDANWFSDINTGDEIVLFGIWRATTGEARESTLDRRFKTHTTHRLSLSLKLMAQLVKIPAY
jgi:hypothetical protein